MGSSSSSLHLPSAPTAPPCDVSASAVGGVSLVSWAAVAGDDSNGKVAGYTVEMLNVSGVAAPQRSVYNVSGPPLKLYGAADGLKVWLMEENCQQTENEARAVDGCHSERFTLPCRVWEKREMLPLQVDIVDEV